MTGTIIATETGPDTYSVVAHMTFRINGRTFAAIEGTDETIAIRDPNGQMLPEEEALAVNRLLRAPAQIYLVITGLLQPPVNLLLGQ